MDIAAEFRRALDELDVKLVRKLWAHVSPHLPAPASDDDALAALHVARTAADSMPFKKRAYSHRWLLERSLPSQMPDRLKPSAEKLYPRIVEGVGISVQFSAPELAPAAVIIRSAMSDAVNDAYADGRTDPVFVKQRMAEASKKARRELFGARSHLHR